ncbi:hypothetical protein [Roseivivax sp. CAU 1753]
MADYGIHIANCRGVTLSLDRPLRIDPAIIANQPCARDRAGAPDDPRGPSDGGLRNRVLRWFWPAGSTAKGRD